MTAEYGCFRRHAYRMRGTVAQFNLNVTLPSTRTECNIVVPTSVFLFWNCTCNWIYTTCRAWFETFTFNRSVFRIIILKCLWLRYFGKLSDDKNRVYWSFHLFFISLIKFVHIFRKLKIFFGQLWKKRRYSKVYSQYSHCFLPTV